MPCTISYSEEAYEEAERALASIVGWTVTVTPRTSLAAEAAKATATPFVAAVAGTARDADDGQIKVTLHPWDEERERPDSTSPVVLDLYDDIDRIEVI